MSFLSDSLERHLRELQNPKPKSTESKSFPAPVPNSGDPYRVIEHSVHLVYQKGTSNKEYLVQFVSLGNGKYEVHFQYGRIGNKLQAGKKTAGPVSYQEAHEVYGKVVEEKISGGYSHKRK